MSELTDDGTDPRIARTRRVVGAATLEELAVAGYGGFTIESVARRARVSKSTIYRHWSGKLPLIADALERMNTQPARSPGVGSARDRVGELVGHLAAAMRDPTLSGSAPALAEAAERDPVIARFHHSYNDRRRQALVDAIRDGVERGELADGVDPELAALMLAGAVVYARMMTARPLADTQADALVNQLFGD
jgi:AcrR family transcriptional regulator